MVTLRMFAADVLAAQADHSEGSKLLVGSACILVAVGVALALLRKKS